MENTVPKGLVSLIERADPGMLKTFAEQHPGSAAMLGAPRTRNMQGDASVKDIETARLDLLLKGIPPLRSELSHIQDVVLGMVRRVQSIKLFGAVVAALSGLVMAITTLMQLGEDWDKVVTAVFATIGGLVVVFSDYFQTAPNGRRIASAEEYGKLSQMAAELMKLERRTQRHDRCDRPARDASRSGR